MQTFKRIDHRAERLLVPCLLTGKPGVQGQVDSRRSRSPVRPPARSSCCAGRTVWQLQTVRRLRRPSALDGAAGAGHRRLSCVHRSGIEDIRDAAGRRIDGGRDSERRRLRSLPQYATRHDLLPGGDRLRHRRPGERLLQREDGQFLLRHAAPRGCRTEPNGQRR